MIGDFMIGLHAVSGLQRLNVRYSPHLHAHRPGPTWVSTVLCGG